MRKLVAIGLVGIVLALAVPSARAGHGCGPSCYPSVQYVEKTVTCYRPEWQERDVTRTVMRAHLRTVEKEHTCTVMVPEWTPQQRTVYVCRYEPKEIERDVTYCRMVSVPCTDPCTGCTYTTCKPEYYTQKVKYQVMQPVYDKKEITVNVCTFKPQQKTYKVYHTVCEYKPEDVTYKHRYCVMVPYEAKVKVPVCCH